MKFIDLFAGIGGFHLVFKSLGAKCVFACENDKYARQTYIANHKIEPTEFEHDINDVDISLIPDFDLLCAGFPCQPFSNIGLTLGFKDHRGKLFFNIIDILREKQPMAFLLENVKGLTGHGQGETFASMKDKILNTGYSFYYFILKASDYGLPQMRERLFMVGFKDMNIRFRKPAPIPLKFNMSDVLSGKCEKEIGYTIRIGGRGSPIGDKRNWDGYIVDDKEHRLTVANAKKMMGFPDDFVFPVSDTQAMKQLGNSVAINVVEAIGKQIMECL